MPTGFEALAVALIAVIPGALYIWAVERLVGRWGIGLSDRLFRFIGVSTVFHALLAPATYAVWFNYFRDGAHDSNEALPLWLWGVVLLYVALPIAAGSVVGSGIAAGKRWAQLFVGNTPAPTAWDQLFFERASGWVLGKLKSGDWIGGKFDENSYAGGYPEPADLFLEHEAAVNPDTGDFIRDEDGDPQMYDLGVLVRWDEIEYLEVWPVVTTPDEEEDEDEESNDTSDATEGNPDGLQGKSEDVDDETRLPRQQDGSS